jgi:hypothetical protein
MALILIGAVVTLSALAYGAARRSAIEAATERFNNAVNRVSNIAGTGIQNLTRQAALVAADSSIVNVLRNPGSPLTEQAQSALRRLRTDSTLPLKVAILDIQGRPVEGVTPELVREGPIETIPPIDTVTIHPFRAVNGMLEYVIAVPVIDSGRVVGQLVQWRSLTRVTQSLRLISDLIGSHALLIMLELIAGAGAQSIASASVCNQL